METNAFQQLIKDRLHETYPYIPAIGVKHYTDKAVRLLGLQPFFERGLHISKSIGPANQQAFLEEYLTFPHGDHDDILDAMETAFSCVYKHQAVVLTGDSYYPI